jgi:hypothetical protein
MLDPVVQDRILKALNFQEGDRVPIWDYLDNRDIWNHFAAPADTYEQGIVKVYHGLGIDLCRGYGASYGCDDDGKVRQTGKVEYRVAGRSLWLAKKPIQSQDDLRSYQPVLAKKEAVRQGWLAEIRRRQKLFEPLTMYVPGHGCGFHATYGLMGLELFSYAIYECRSEIERVMDVLCSNAVVHAEVCTEEKLSPLFFVGDDIAYKGRLMCSPKFLRETFIRCLRRVCEPCVKAGIKVIFHSDGNVMEILDDMIDAGIGGLNPIEPIAGMDIGLLKKRYGRNLVLVGNVDCSQVLPLGTPEDVTRATQECIRAASPGGGHFIGSSSEIVPSTPVENVLAFYRACRRYGRYPITC